MVMTECIVNYKGGEKHSSDEFSSLPADTYYFYGKEIRRCEEKQYPFTTLKFEA